MKLLICALSLLVACLATGADVADKKDITSLPPEEQQMAQGIKITSVEPAPSDTRQFTYIKGAVKLRNGGPNHLVAGKMEVELWLLFKNRDKKWGVVHTTAPLDVPQKGPQTVDVSFKGQNREIEVLTGDRNARPDDVYAVVRYSGVVIYEQPAKQPSRVPKEWWKSLPPG